ncbi:MAG: ATP-dependent helicase [Haloferacaceae archaeon]
MSGRDLLAAAVAEQGLEFDPETVPIADAGVLDRLAPPVREWWVETFAASVPGNGGFFTPPQREAIPHIDRRTNTLVAAPTGSGKTLSAYAKILDDLFERGREREDGLANSVYCLYVSPLKSLANDVHRNLTAPLEGIAGRVAARDDPVEVRHAIRHGDTDDAERRAMLAETPHVLNTTPETLAILLNAPSFREKLRTVEYVVVDEVHDLAANKRGTHLAVSLERLAALADGSPTRIGCSATVEPLATMAEFLVGRTSPGGPPREHAVVDTRSVRDDDLRLECPTDDLVGTPREVVTDRFYDRLHELVDAHDQTLVFTNSRSGAERVLHELRERFDAVGGTDADGAAAACHHGSLSEARREAVEAGLKAGDLDVVTTSTSLELGVDMPHVDLVVQVGSPKSVAALLQRVGRAGHRPGETVTGRVLVLDHDELVECAALLREAAAGAVDRAFVPENAHDVAAQHVYGMAIADVRPERELRAILRRAYPYRAYGGEAWERLMRYLTADYEGLAERNVYPKVWRDTNDPPGGEHHREEFPVGEPLVGKRGRLARAIYMQNVGTIPDSFAVEVVTRDGDERVGDLDGDYLDTLDPGDVFVLGGDRFTFRYRRGSKVYVDRTDDRPTVPSWYAERLPRSYDLGRATLAFRRELLDRVEAGGRPAARDWLRTLPLDEHAVRALARTFDEQVRFAGPESVATDGRIVVEAELDREAYRRRFYVHAGYGRRVNDALARLVARGCGRGEATDVDVAVADDGFTVAMPLDRKVDVAGTLRGLDPDAVRPTLRDAVADTGLLERHFRLAATRSLLLLKRYKGYEKSAAEQQVAGEMLLPFVEDLDGFAVLEEAYREVLEDELHVDAVAEVVDRIDAGEVEVVEHGVETPTPLAFGLATLAATDAVLSGDEGDALRSLHERVRAAVGDDGRDGPGSDSGAGRSAARDDGRDAADAHGRDAESGSTAEGDDPPRPRDRGG